MRNHLHWLATSHGDSLQSAGYALKTLADLLGADGSAHDLTDHEITGLTHAVRALGGYALSAGRELYEAGEKTKEVAK